MPNRSPFSRPHSRRGESPKRSLHPSPQGVAWQVRINPRSSCFALRTRLNSIATFPESSVAMHSPQTPATQEKGGQRPFLRRAAKIVSPDATARACTSPSNSTVTVNVCDGDAAGESVFIGESRAWDSRDREFAGGIGWGEGRVPLRATPFGCGTYPSDLK